MFKIKPVSTATSSQPSQLSWLYFVNERRTRINYFLLPGVHTCLATLNN